MTLPAFQIGLWQDETPKGGPSVVIDQIADALTQAKAAGVALLVFPECYLTGYYHPEADMPGVARSVTAAHMARLAALADDRGVAFVLGAAGVAGASVLNVAHVFLPRAAAPLTYAKRALFGPWEKAVFTPGTAPLLFDYQGRRFAVLICFDVEFPEHVREAAQGGADTVLVPTALMAPEDDVADYLVPARAIESEVSIVYANRIGTEGPLTFIGKSQICTPLSRDRRVASGTFRGLLHGPLFTGAPPVGYLDEIRRLQGAT